MAGAPKGNQNASKGRMWQDALKKALRDFSRAAIPGDENTAPKSAIEAGRALQAIAQTVVEAAIDGDWWAVAEIGNRLDGKPAQTLEVQGDIRHVHELTDSELIERLQRARDPRGIMETPSGPQDAEGVH